MPGVGHDCVAVVPVPSSNDPSLSRSQPRAAMSPSGSVVQVESNVTAWPVSTGARATA